MKHTEETKQKLREKMTGRKVSKETRLKMSLSAKGRRLSQQSKDKISRKNKGKPAWNKGLSNPKAIENLGDYAKGKSGVEHPNWKGGLIYNNGYCYVYNLDLGRHFGGKYIKRADLVWFEATGELIITPFELHHENGIKDDDRIENLVKLKKPYHSETHLKERDAVVGRNNKGQFNKLNKVKKS